MAEKQRSQWKFGLGELYARSFADLSPEDRLKLTSPEVTGTTKAMVCPPRSYGGRTVLCNKKGGVCSIRLYERDEETGSVHAETGYRGLPRTVCPSRLDEGGLIYQWIGETLLGDRNALVLGEVPFLERASKDELESAEIGRSVGKIDNILVSKTSVGLLNWCALEKQAVYFQGSQ